MTKIVWQTDDAEKGVLVEYRPGRALIMLDSRESGWPDSRHVSLDVPLAQACQIRDALSAALDEAADYEAEQAAEREKVAGIERLLSNAYYHPSRAELFPGLPGNSWPGTATIAEWLVRSGLTVTEEA